MAKGTEARLKAMIIDHLKSRGAWHLKTLGTGFGRRGIPDILACYRGRFVALEIKAPKGKLSALQDHELSKIHDAGGVSAEVRSAEEVKGILDAIDCVPHPAAK